MRKLRNCIVQDHSDIAYELLKREMHKKAHFDALNESFFSDTEVMFLREIIWKSALRNEEHMLFGIFTTLRI